MRGVRLKACMKKRGLCGTNDKLAVGQLQWGRGRGRTPRGLFLLLSKEPKRKRGGGHACATKNLRKQITICCTAAQEQRKRCHSEAKSRRGGGEKGRRRGRRARIDAIQRSGVVSSHTLSTASKAVTLSAPARASASEVTAVALGDTSTSTPLSPSLLLSALRRCNERNHPAGSGASQQRTVQLFQPTLPGVM